jgi:hypothetical protein
MDLKTTYKKEFTAKSSEVKNPERSSTPQPTFKFKGNSQYSRDYPNWGPVSFTHNKRPVHPIHETKMKFHSKSSYSQDFSMKASQGNNCKIQKSVDEIKGFFEAPLMSTSQREYTGAVNDYLVVYNKREPDAYMPTVYNPNQFGTTFRASYVKQLPLCRDPAVARREGLLKKSK